MRSNLGASRAFSDFSQTRNPRAKTSGAFLELAFDSNHPPVHCATCIPSMDRQIVDKTLSESALYRSRHSLLEDPLLLLLLPLASGCFVPRCYTSFIPRRNSDNTQAPQDSAFPSRLLVRRAKHGATRGASEDEDELRSAPSDIEETRRACERSNAPIAVGRDRTRSAK